ncbi:MAG: lysophospholipid acyltransferase family protein [Bacteriovoracaceae bacterium]|nr:1-acyl-sn-glycerol-3-phosphate acyltransferase [Bacteroidota bacterium]
MRWAITILRLIVIATTCIPFSIAAIITIPFDRSGRTYFWCGRTWTRFALFICRIEVAVVGLEKVDPYGNYILVSNHASMFDIPVMMKTFPHIRIMFKKELSYVPFWGWALRWGHHIMVDRSKGTEAMKSLDRAANDVRSGGQVLLFAEGTRTRDGKLLPFKRGAFALAAKSGVPLVPVTINGSFRILPKGSFDIQPSKIEVKIEIPIETTSIVTREDEVTLMNTVKEIITKNYREEV